MVVIDDTGKTANFRLTSSKSGELIQATSTINKNSTDIIKLDEKVPKTLIVKNSEVENETYKEFWNKILIPLEKITKIEYK